jgi:hypothetical protein
MTDASMTTGDNIVPLFRTFDELQANETAIAVDAVREWNEANQAYDAAMSKVAALKKNPPGDISEDYPRTIAALKKMATQNPSAASTCNSMIQDLAALEIHRIDLASKLAISQAETDALAQLGAARKAVIEKRDQRMFGFGALARRSQRFATAQLNKAYGPGAASLPKN